MCMCNTTEMTNFSLVGTLVSSSVDHKTLHQDDHKWATKLF
jgi:hypothetical protein